MTLGHNFDTEKDDVFHSHGYAKVAYGANLGASSSVPGGGRAGIGNVGAVGTYRYADVSHRPKREKQRMSEENGNSRGTLHVSPRDEDTSKAAFSHKNPAEPTIRTFREPPGRSYNPYS